MTWTTTSQRTGAPSAARRGAARDTLAPDLGDVRADLDTVASELRALWSSAPEGGDFGEITRLVEASHAVHRAVVAVSPDSLVPASRESRLVAAG